MSTKIQYSSYGNSIDGTNYCSGVETLAENIVEENEEDAVIVFPSKDGWASLRSTSYRMTTENTEAVLPLPIYKIKRFLLKIPENISFAWREEVTKEALLSDFIDENGDSISREFDITHLIFPVAQWQALPLANSGEEYLDKEYKDNTFYWEEGSCKIPFSGTVYKIGANVIDGLNDNTPSYYRLLRSLLYKNGNKYNYLEVYNLSTIAKNGTIKSGSKDLDVRDWLFRIEYVPVSTKTKIRARKAAKTREEFIQPFNQRAEINAASAFGKNMYLTAQKTGVKELVLVKRYTRLADIPPIGTVIYQNGKAYRLVANNYKVTNTIYVEVTHVYSENWSRKSQHVSVDQKYRNWKIPQDILWRNLYREDYLICSTSPITPLVPSKLNVDLVTRLFLCGDTSADKTINTLCWLFTPKNETAIKGVTVPCSTYGTANSMIFSATFKDNLSAGLTMAKVTNENSQEALCEEAFYCNEDGTLDKATVILSSGLSSRRYDPENDSFGSDEFNAAVGMANINARSVYPKISFYTDPFGNKAAANAPKDELYRDTYKILKDPGEALKYTYQVHIVPDQADLGVIVIGDKFAELSPLVKDWGDTRTLNFVLSERPLREGEQIVVGDAYTQSNNLSYFYYSAGTEGARLQLLKTATDLLESNPNYVAWAICDEKNRLLIGCNDKNKSDINFRMAHKR